MHDFADIELSFGSFPTLVELCKADPRFPQLFDAWESMVARDSAAARRQGVAPSPTHIDPDRFGKWCVSFGVAPSFDSLRAYCMIHKLPRGSHHYGPTPLDSDVGPLGP
jgi:hypothetical protein